MATAMHEPPRLPKIKISSTYLILIIGFTTLIPVRGTDYTTTIPADSLVQTTEVYTADVVVNDTSAVGAAPPSFRREGDYVLGGLFDLHLSQNGECGEFNPRGLQRMHAMVYAIEQLNARDDILPNVTLGFHIFDSCADNNVAIRNSVHFIRTKDESATCQGGSTEDNIAAVIGPGSSGAAVSVASLFNLFMVPQVSDAATSDLLSESRFEYFTRTVPVDTYQARAMAHLASHFDFNTVAVLATDDGAYGLSGIVVFENEAAHLNICVAYKSTFSLDDTDADLNEIVEALRQLPEVKVIVTFANEGAIIRLLSYFSEQNITGYVWIASDGWGASQIVENPVLSKVANGMLGVSPHANNIPDFNKYLFGLTPKSLQYEDPFFTEFWEKYFECYITEETKKLEMFNQECTESESLSDTDIYTNTSRVSSTLDAVEVVARSLHTLLGCTDDDCSKNVASIDGQDLIEFMKNVSFMGRSGYQLRPNVNGNLPEVAWYDFYNLQPTARCSSEYRLRQIGFWRNDTDELSIPSPEELYWPMLDTCDWSAGPPNSLCGRTCHSGTRRVTLDFSTCCWECVSCSENHFSNVTDALTCHPCGEEQISKEDRTGCIDLPYRYTSPTSHIGIAVLAASFVGWVICIVIIILFILKRNTVIIYHAFASSWKNLMLGIMFCFVAACLSVIPASDIACVAVAGCQLLPVSVVEGTMIVAGYMSYHRKSVQFNNWALSMVAVLIVHGLCVLLWILTSRPVVTNTVDRTQRVVYVDCVSSSTFDGVIVVIGYGLVLDAIGVFVSFSIRNREKNFQEGKFIFFSFIIQAMIWVAILAIYIVLPKGRHFRTFVISLGMMISSTALIGCLFVPKLYVVRFKPDINPPVKRRHSAKLWQWKFKRRGEDIPVEVRFGDVMKNHAARRALLENYRKALAAIRDETAQAVRMRGVCCDRMEDMKIRHRKRVDELNITTTNLKSSRIQLVLSSPSVEVTYC